jgi:hypothetical protein
VGGQGTLEPILLDLHADTGAMISHGSGKEELLICLTLSPNWLLERAFSKSKLSECTQRFASTESGIFCFVFFCGTEI